MLSLDGQVLAEYNMSKERYTIGRLPDNDVRIVSTFSVANPGSTRLTSSELRSKNLD